MLSENILTSKYSRFTVLIITFTQAEETPLMSACMLGYTATARVLLEHGASVDHCNDVRDLQHAHTL